jgi:glycosyltransferase involved in cell wall biosynthesis
VSRDGVTIAIPNWNHEVLLPRAVSSALAAVRALGAEGCPAEVLVVDDGSRDGSLPLLRQLEALHFKDGFRAAARASNGGLSAARNHALALARYRHVAFLDADNELVPENTPCLWRALSDTGAAAAYGNLLIRTVSSTETFHVLSNESFHDSVYEVNHIDAFAMVDRDQLLDVGAYHPLGAPHEDHELWLHLAAHGREVVFVPVVFGYYYLLATSMNADQSKAWETNARIRRVHDQTRARRHLPVRTRCRRYHPEVGYLC